MKSQTKILILIALQILAISIKAEYTYQANTTAASTTAATATATATAVTTNAATSTTTPKLVSPQLVNSIDIPKSNVYTSVHQVPHSTIQASGYTTQSTHTYLPGTPQGNTLHIVKPVSVNICPCAGVVQACPVCGVDNPADFVGCPCDPNRPQCPPCILAKTVKQMHVQAAENAKIDSQTQERLAKQSELERQLFAQAKKWAKEAENEESIAYKLSLELQQHSSKAQIARNNMIRAQNQAKQLALDAIHQMSVYPSHPGVSVPGLSIKQTGVKRSAVYQSQPQYQLSIQNTDNTGFIDQNDFEFQSAIDQASNKSSEPAQQQQQPQAAAVTEDY